MTIVTVAFTPCDPATWPMALNIDQVAAIFQTTPRGIRQKLHRHRWQPMPFAKYPMRWRKGDVLRTVEGARGGLRRAG